MKTTNEINCDILKITMQIEELFPELSKYIGEMPVKISYCKGSEIADNNLQDYFDSLDELLINYVTYNKSITS